MNQQTQWFDGNGVTTTFTVAGIPVGDVFLNGLLCSPDDCTLVGSSAVFFTPPGDTDQVAIPYFALPPQPGPVPEPFLTIDGVIEALGNFIQPFVGVDTQIIRAQVNRVAPPIGSFVELTELLQVDLEYARSYYDDDNQQLDIIGPKRIAIQVDFYGKQSGDWCSAVKTCFRTAYGVAQFPAGIAPLYTDEAHEAPLLTGEQQYERRWVLTCNLQFNPIVIVPLQSADVLEMNIVEGI